MSEVSRRDSAKSKPSLAGHHHVEHDDFERQAFQPRPRLRRGGDRGDAIAVAAEIGGDEIAQAPVVVDDEHVRGVVGRRARAAIPSPPWRSRRRATAPKSARERVRAPRGRSSRSGTPPLPCGRSRRARASRRRTAGSARAPVSARVRRPSASRTGGVAGDPRAPARASMKSWATSSLSTRLRLCLVIARMSSSSAIVNPG